jgi:Pectinacetylesterase
VIVPYCTGDVFLGDKVNQYAPDLTIHHVGAVNAKAALDGLVATFPGTKELLVTGESAGGIPTPLMAGEAQDALPAASIKVLADGSGAYPDVPAVNAVIGDAWGTLNAVPPWPENAGVTAETWSIPGLFVRAGKHAPSVVFTRHDYAFDNVQSSFAALAGIDPSNLVSLIDTNEQQIEAAGVPLASYVAPGSDHTVLHKPGFYTETVNGVVFVDWVTDLVEGMAVSDVHCQECKTG